MSDKATKRSLIGLRNVKVTRNYILLIAAIFAAELGYGIVIPALQLYSTKVLGATVGMVGVAIAAFPFTNTFLKIFGGSLADRYGRRLMIAIGLTISCLSPLLLSLINVSWLIWLYIPIRAMDGTGNSVIWPAANAMVADMMGRKRRDAALGVLNLSFALGSGVGPAIGLYLMDWFGGVEGGGAKWTFWSASILNGLTALGAFLFMQETLRRRKREPAKSLPRTEVIRNWWKELGQALSALYKNGKLLALSLQGFINMFIVGINTSVLVFYADNVLKLQTYQIGFGFLFLSLSTILCVYPAGRYAERIGRKYLMIFGMFLVSSAMVMLPFITRAGFYYTMMLMSGAGVAMILPSWMSLSVENMPLRGRATVLGGVGTITSFGLVVGPIVAGYLYEGIAPQAPFFFAAALIAANAVFITYVFRDHHERNRYRRAEYRSPYYVPRD